MLKEMSNNMEAPDKVWINTDTLEGYYMSNHPLCGEEYIRKDALIKLMKRQKAWLNQGYKKDWKNEDTLNGGRLMLDRLINKIESL